MFTLFLPSNSDHVMSRLGGYNCSVCNQLHVANCTIVTSQTTWSELSGNKDVQCKHVSQIHLLLPLHWTFVYILVPVNYVMICSYEGNG